MKTVIERIIDEVHETLSSVKVANGCSYDLCVELEKREGNDPQHLKCVVYQDEPEPDEEAGTNRDSWRQPFTLVTFIGTDGENDQTPASTYLNRIAGDIVKALAADPTRGGLAIDTEKYQPRWGTADNGTWLVLILGFEVRYRTRLHNPFEASA